MSFFNLSQNTSDTCDSFRNNSSEEKSTIIFGQQNLHKAYKASQDINKWFHRNVGKKKRYTMGILLVQEPSIHKNKNTISGFFGVEIHQATSKNRIRAGIITSKDFVAWPIAEFTNADQSVIGFKSQDKTIVVASTYMPGDSVKAPPPEIFKDLVKYCRDNNFELIGGSDANAHSVLWGSTANNNRGEALTDFIFTNNLHCCNIGNKPTYENVLRGQVLDITLATTNILDNILNWEVSNECKISDHRLITFEFVTNIVPDLGMVRSIRKTDWKKYQVELDKKTRDLDIDQLELDDAAELVNKAITDSFELSCRLKHRVLRTEASWWTKELTELKRNVKKLKRRYYRDKTEDRKKEYNRADTLYSREIDKAKAKGWKNLCSELDDMTLTARLHKIMKQGRQPKLGTVLKQDGSYTKNPEETLEVLMDTHFPKAETNNTDNLNNIIEDIDVNNVEKIIESINIESVRAAIKGFKPYKAAGFDQIKPVLLQKGIDSLDEILVKLFRRSVREGIIPKIWLQTKIIFLPKPAKDNYLSPKSFRPISLQSFLLKTVERLLYWYINTNNIINKKFFNDNLFSYREGIGPEDALHNVVHQVEKAIEKGEYCIILFLDIDSAFSAASIEGMVNNLLKYNIDPCIVRWVRFMLLNRDIIIEAFNEMLRKRSDRGAPQGGIFSGVILWNLVMDNLLRRFPKPHPTNTTGFADDGADVGSGKDINTVVSSIQNDIEVMVEWAEEHGLRFAAGKTKAMLFTSKTNIPPVNDLVIYGEKIEWVSSFKYLGVTLDNRLLHRSQLNWGKHIENVSNRATITWAIVRKMVGRKWGLSPKICRYSYITLIRPIYTYGCMIWISSLDIESHLHTLGKVQRKALLQILNGMRSTPTATMEMMANILPLKLYLQSNAVSTYLRLIKNNTWRVIDGEVTKGTNHSMIVSKLANQVKDIQLPRDKLRFKEMIGKNFEILIESRDMWTDRQIRPAPIDEGKINIFTDGSKTDISSGCGYILKGKNISSQGNRNLGSTTTVFQAEITALIDASEDFLGKEIKEKEVNIYVDSQAALKALDSYTVRESTVATCKKLLNKIGKRNRLALHWIPSHRGHLGNEVADRLARLGTGSNTYGPALLIPVPVSNGYIKQQINSWVTKNYDKYWTNIEGLRQSKMMIPKVTKTLWYKIQNLTRAQMRVSTHMLTGHCILRYHLCNMEIEPSARCLQCGEEEDETAAHFLGRCPRFNNIRYSIFRRQIIEERDLKDLSINKILEFVRKTRRYEQEEI